MKTFRPLLFSYVVVSLATALATLRVSAAYGYPPVGTDDANIFFVYAKHLASGAGLVYNVGGERVEGFTSMLWTLVSAAAFKVFAEPERVLLIACVAMVAAAATAATLFIARFCEEFREDSPAAGESRRWLWTIVYVALLLTTPAYLAWTTISLLDNALWSVLLLSMTVFVTGRNISPFRLAAIGLPLCVLLVLTRPESFVWVPCFIGVILVRYVRSHGLRRAILAVTPMALASVAAASALIAFRLWYFGYPFPNTYYAKFAPSLAFNLQEGSKYLIRYVVSDPVVCIAIVSVVLCALHVMRVFGTLAAREQERLHFLPFLALVGLGIPVVSGGDHFGGFRFYQNVYPIVLLCAVYFAALVVPTYVSFQAPAIRYRSVRVGVALVLVAVLAVIQATSLRNDLSIMAIEFRLATSGRDLGALMHAMLRDDGALPSVGVIAAGGIKRGYPGPVVDLMGLNETHMAHNAGERRGWKNHAAFEKRTFYELRPTIVAPTLVGAADWEYSRYHVQTSLANRALKHIFDDPQFRERYVFTAMARPDVDATQAIVAWVSRDYVEELERGRHLAIRTYVYEPAPDSFVVERVAGSAMK